MCPVYQQSAPSDRWRPGLGWLTAVAILAVLAVNVAGIWGIAVTRRGALEDSRRLFGLETAARARLLESVLASTRADLAFLAGSPPFARVEVELESDDPQEVGWRRRAVEGALLIFMRGHPEVSRVVLRSRDGRPLVAAVRRGGVPVVWLAARSEARSDDLAVATDPRHLTGLFSVTAGGEPSAEAPRIVASIDANGLLQAAAGAGEPDRVCFLRDQTNGLLASDPASPEIPTATERLAAAGVGGSGWIGEEAALEAEGWTWTTPWHLVCTRSGTGAVALLDPLTSRYRQTLALNLLVMLLAVLLGGFAILQIRRRLGLEARARESDRVRDLERQLFHAERLGTAGRLAAGIAHEINNPLEGMANYLHLAGAELERGQVEAARRRLDGVREGLDAAAGIVRRVLAHADPSSPPRDVLDLNDVLRQALGWVRSHGAFEAIAFRNAFEAKPVHVQGNATQLGQVFLNLLLNACEMQPSGGEVQVETRREGGRIVASVADRGPGVPESDRVRIFEPFYSTKHSTGLGLSVCWSIVRGHDGELTVRDRDGGGAIFEVALPALEHGDARSNR